MAITKIIGKSYYFVVGYSSENVHAFIGNLAIHNP